MLKSAGMFLLVSFALLGSASVAESAEQDAKQAAITQNLKAVERATRPEGPPTTELEAKLKARLVSLGLTSEEAREKIAALTPADLQKFGQNPEQVAMAGIKDTTLILIAVILVLPGLLLLLMAM